MRALSGPLVVAVLRSPGRPAAVLVLAAGLLLGSGITATGQSPDPSPLSSAAPSLEDLLRDSEARVEDLQAQVDALTAQVARLSQSQVRSADSLAEIGKLRGPMEADRLLLLELRKELPPTRPEAEAYLQRLGRLALASDPVRLDRLALRLREASPAYLDWRDQEFDTQEAAAQAFTESGASAFQVTFSEFKNAILLTAASRLDALLNLFERVDGIEGPAVDGVAS